MFTARFAVDEHRHRLNLISNSNIFKWRWSSASHLPNTKWKFCFFFFIAVDYLIFSMEFHHLPIFQSTVNAIKRKLMKAAKKRTEITMKKKNTRQSNLIFFFSRVCMYPALRNATTSIILENGRCWSHRSRFILNVYGRGRNISSASSLLVNQQTHTISTQQLRTSKKTRNSLWLLNARLTKRQHNVHNPLVFWRFHSHHTPTLSFARRLMKRPASIPTPPNEEDETRSMSTHNVCYTHS